MSKKVIYGANILNVGDEVTVADAKSRLSQFYPEIANATATTASNGDITFTVQSGSKGMSKKVVYGANVITVGDEVTVADAKSRLSQFYPELANASAAVADNGDITFTVQSGSKGI